MCGSATNTTTMLRVLIYSDRFNICSYRFIVSQVVLMLWSGAFALYYIIVLSFQWSLIPYHLVFHTEKNDNTQWDNQQLYSCNSECWLHSAIKMTKMCWIQETLRIYGRWLFIPHCVATWYVQFGPSQAFFVSIVILSGHISPWDIFIST